MYEWIFSYCIENFIFTQNKLVSQLHYDWGGFSVRFFWQSLIFKKLFKQFSLGIENLFVERFFKVSNDRRTSILEAEVRWYISTFLFTTNVQYIYLDTDKKQEEKRFVLLHFFSGYFLWMVLKKFDLFLTIY